MMKPSPLGSRILSGYAIVFAALVPVAFAVVGLISGVGLHLAVNVVLGVAIAYLGARVFAGDYTAVKAFAILVILHYLGLTLTNAWNFDEFPVGSRAKQMAVSRMVRGVLFAGVYAWYYLIRRKTAEGFNPAQR
jgi:hypothetical protein